MGWMNHERLSFEHRAVNRLIFRDLRIVAQKHLACIGLRIDLDEENLLAFSG
jgi:hypothetical protein